jgi:hypothetical protein
MNRVITVSDVQDYLSQFDGNAEITLMEDDKPVRLKSDEDASEDGFVCLETMMDQFHDMGGEQVDYQPFGGDA